MCAQWFVFANLDKKEYFDPRCFTESASLQGVATHSTPFTYLNAAGVLVYLLRQSDHWGGGDLGFVPQKIEMDPKQPIETDEQYQARSMETIKEVAQRSENQMLAARPELQPIVYAGRWAGDRIAFVGDYDSSGLYQIIVTDQDGWVDITDPVDPPRTPAAQAAFNPYEEIPFCKELWRLLLEPVRKTQEFQIGIQEMVQKAEAANGQPTTIEHMRVNIPPTGKFQA